MGSSVVLVAIQADVRLLLAARDRTPRAARDQREEAGAFGEGRVSQVGNCVDISGGLLTVIDGLLLGISRAGLLRKARSRSSASNMPLVYGGATENGSAIGIPCLSGLPLVVRPLAVAYFG